MSNTATPRSILVVASEETPAYRAGKALSKQAGHYRDPVDLIVFKATLRLPSDSTPLRREDFFEFEEYLRGFYDDLAAQEAALRRENSYLRHMVSELEKRNLEMELALVKK